MVFKRSEAREISRKKDEWVKCDTIQEVWNEISEIATSGVTNCHIRVSEEKLHLIKKNLLAGEFDVYSECATNYQSGEQYHNLEINWH